MQYWQGVGPRFIYNEDMHALRDAIENSFEPKSNVAFLTICSWGKPYSASYIHRGIRRFLGPELVSKMDYIHVSSAGVIPAAAELHAVNYDWNNEWVQDEFTLNVLRDAIHTHLYQFFLRFRYEKVLVYLRPEGNTYRAVQKAFDAGRRSWVDVYPNLDKTLPFYATEINDVRSDGLYPDPDDDLIIPSRGRLMAELVRKELE